MGISHVGRLLAGVLIAVGLLVPGTGSAHDFNEQGALQILPTRRGFEGSVDHNYMMCRVERRIYLMKILRNGDRRVVSRTRSESDSSYVFSTPNARGQFFTKAPAFHRDSPGHQHRCARTRSVTVSR